MFVALHIFTSYLSSSTLILCTDLKDQQTSVLLLQPNKGKPMDIEQLKIYSQIYSVMNILGSTRTRSPSGMSYKIMIYVCNGISYIISVSYEPELDFSKGIPVIQNWSSSSLLVSCRKIQFRLHSKSEDR